MAGVFSAGLLALVAVANALPQASTGSSCEQLGSGSQHGAYTITCGTDRVGGDLSNGQASSLSGCIPQCDALPNCVGFTYVKSNGFCYFKSSFAATSTDPNVDVAVKPISSSSSSSSSSAPATGTSASSSIATSSASSSTATSSGTAASASAAPTSTATGSCADIGSGNTFNGAYTATCQTDAPGGDLSSAQASPFAACAPICDTLAGCIGFAYVPGNCYFKSSKSGFSSNSNVGVAFKPASSTTPSTSAGASTSSSASTSAGPSTTPSASRSCAAIGSGATFNGGYTATCQTDASGGDLSSAQASSFSACATICDTLAGCIGFAYVPGVCYFKSSQAPFSSNSNVDVAFKPVSSSTSSSASSSASSPASSSVAPSTTTSGTTSASSSAAPTQSASPGSCASLGATSGGYQISCATDFPGGDLSNAQSPSFAGCVTQCNALAGCIGFSYVGGSNAGTCYFKSSQGSSSLNQGVDSAFRPISSTTPANSPATSSSAASSSSAATSFSAATTTTAAPPQSAAPGSCAALGNGSTSGGYQISCGTDYPSGNLSNAPSSTFAGCATQCDALQGCVGFSYVGGSGSGVCYFKSSQSGGSPNANVDSGFRPTPVSTTTTARTTSATSAPSSSAPSTTASSSAAPSTTVSSSSAPASTSSAPATTQPTSSTVSSSSTSSSVAPVPTTMSTTVRPSTTSSTAAPTTTSVAPTTTSAAPITTSAAPTTTSAAPTTTSAAPSTSAAPAPSGSIINPVSPAGADNAFCTALRAAPQFKLRSVVTSGNRALDDLFLQAPSFTGIDSPPRLVSGVTNGGRYVQTNSVNLINILPAIASVTPSGTCSVSGLALYNSNTEQGPVGLVPNIGTASTTDIVTTTNYLFPFQLYRFGSFYACSATGGATLRWVRADSSNLFGIAYQSLDLNNCALVQLQKIIA